MKMEINYPVLQATSSKITLENVLIPSFGPCFGLGPTPNHTARDDVGEDHTEPQCEVAYKKKKKKKKKSD